MILNVHQKDGQTVVAVCDKELLGNVYSDGDTQLDLSSDFYKGEEMDAAEAGDIIRNADSVNLVGEKAVALGISEEVITEENVKEIAGIKYAQCVIERE